MAKALVAKPKSNELSPKGVEALKVLASAQEELARGVILTDIADQGVASASLTNLVKRGLVTATKVTIEEVKTREVNAYELTEEGKAELAKLV